MVYDVSSSDTAQFDLLQLVFHPPLKKSVGMAIHLWLPSHSLPAMTLASKSQRLIDSWTLRLVGQLRHFPSWQFETLTSAKHTHARAHISDNISAITQSERTLSLSQWERPFLESVYHKTCMQTVHIIRSCYLMELLRWKSVVENRPDDSAGCDVLTRTDSDLWWTW